MARQGYDLPLDWSAEHRLVGLQPDLFEPGRCPAFQAIPAPMMQIY